MKKWKGIPAITEQVGQHNFYTIYFYDELWKQRHRNEVCGNTKLSELRFFFEKYHLTFLAIEIGSIDKYCQPLRRKHGLRDGPFSVRKYLTVSIYVGKISGSQS